MHDELNFITSFDIEDLHNDRVKITVLEHKLVTNSFNNPRNAPLNNHLKFTKNEYREFLTHMGHASRYFKDWLNSDVFMEGTAMPYRVNEFKTDI